MTALDDALAAVTTLGLDTSAFIYFVEHSPRYVNVVCEVFRRINVVQFSGRSSIITLTEAFNLAEANRGCNVRAHLSPNVV